MEAIKGYQNAEHRSLISRSDFEIFDRTPDPALDELTELAAVLCLADYAYIGWIDFNRLWFKSRSGFVGIEQASAGTGSDWIAATGQSLVIQDAASDQSLPAAGIELPGGRICRSFAAIPLLSQSNRIVGIMAVLAHDAHRFRADHLTLLEVLGRQVMTRLELYHRIRAHEHAQRLRQRTERALEVERCFVSATLDSIPALV